MTMPKKGRREINVDGIIYHYKISGATSIRIENTENNEVINWSMNQSKSIIPTSPGFIRHLIETKGNPTVSMDHFIHESKKNPDYGHEIALKFTESNNFNGEDYKNKKCGEKISIANNVKFLLDFAWKQSREVYGRDSSQGEQIERLCVNLLGQLGDQLTDEEIGAINLYPGRKQKSE